MSNCEHAPAQAGGQYGALRWVPAFAGTYG